MAQGRCSRLALERSGEARAACCCHWAVRAWVPRQLLAAAARRGQQQRQQQQPPPPPSTGPASRLQRWRRRWRRLPRRCCPPSTPLTSSPPWPQTCRQPWSRCHRPHQHQPPWPSMTLQPPPWAFCHLCQLRREVTAPRCATSSAPPPTPQVCVGGRLGGGRSWRAGDWAASASYALWLVDAAWSPCGCSPLTLRTCLCGLPEVRWPEPEVPKVGS